MTMVEMRKWKRQEEGDDFLLRRKSICKPWRTNLYMQRSENPDEGNKM